MKTTFFKSLFKSCLGLLITATASAQCTAVIYPVQTNTCSTITFSAGNFNGLYVWDFGDGSTATYTSNAPVHHYYYPTSGSYYNVTLSLYSGTNTVTPCSTVSQTVAVNCALTNTCQPAFNAVTTANCYQIKFNNHSSLPGSTAYYLWDFGDGTTATAFSNNSLNHTYTAIGSYVASLSIYTSTASTTPCSVSTQTISVNCGTGCAAAFSALNNYMTSCQTYTFANTSTAAGPGAFYKWQFGDGSVANTGSTANVYHTYAANGIYTATLSAYTSTASTTPCSTAYQTLTVSCSTASCLAAFTAASNFTTSSCSNYVFTNTSTAAGPGAFYKWQFGDGGVTNTISMANVYHTYAANGVYTATLSAYTSTASTTPCSTAYQTLTVSCGSATCQANSQFTLFPDTAHPGNYFAYNTSTGSGALSYLWNFGDGNTSTQQYPFHQYATPGHYVVCLQITSTTGTTSCTDTYCDSSSVHRIASGYSMISITGVSQAPTNIKASTFIPSLSAYPNPLSDVLTIELDLNAPANAMSYELVNALGEVVSKDVITGSKTTVGTSSLAHGFYFLSLKDENGNTMRSLKLVK